MLLKYRKASFNMPTTSQTSHLPEVNAKDYWDILVRRRALIFSFGLISTLIVGAANFLITPLYKASTTIVVEGEGSDVQNPSASSEKGMSFDIFENYLQTQMSLILSRSVAGKVFEELKLAQDLRYQSKGQPVKIYFQKKLDDILSVFGLTDKKSPGIPDPLYLFLKDIELERLKGTRAIKIYVYHPNAETAAKIANALAERYSRDNLMRRAMTFIRDQRMGALNADYLRLQSKYDMLSNEYGPKHYEMISLKKEIRALANRIEAENAKKMAMTAEMENQDLSKKEEEKLLDDILRTIQESSVVSSSQMNNIAIADPAIPPTHVAVPNKKRNVLIALIAGLIMGIFFAFFMEYLDDTVKNEMDLKRIIGNANFMGAIPYDDHAKGFRRMAKVDSLVTQRPLSGSAEAYRLLRIQLGWFLKKKPDFKDLAIVSSIPDEGKSTIASNLALALSQINQKVLLVDADIRRGRISRTHGIGKKKGLSDYLINDDLMLNDIIQPTKNPNLWVISRGENTMKGPEFLSFPKMEELIRESRLIFDVIIYDTPPITLIADTAVLISQLHGVIFVTRTRVTRSRIVPKALKMINDTNTSLIGVVLNSTEAIESKYYHRYYKD